MLPIRKGNLLVLGVAAVAGLFLAAAVGPRQAVAAPSPDKPPDSAAEPVRFPDGVTDAERRTAFVEAVAGYPGAAITGVFEGRFAAVSGQLAVRELLAAAKRPLPDAVVCGNDQMALGAMRELQAAGIRVPADIAVAGFDDIHVGSLLTPALTTVRQPMRLLGERACSLLLERLADPSRPRQAERLPTELIIRESCGCPPR